VVSALFEQQQPPAVFLARNAVLASFATGRQTSLVVDAGHEGTTGDATSRVRAAVGDVVYWGPLLLCCTLLALPSP
jgi:Actin